MSKTESILQSPPPIYIPNTLLHICVIHPGLRDGELQLDCYAGKSEHLKPGQLALTSAFAMFFL